MPNWSEDDIRGVLESEAWPATEKEIEHGVQFELQDGTKVNWYKTGNVNVQGKQSKLKRLAETRFQEEQPKRLNQGKEQDREPAPLDAPHRVFIVYGHDTTAREQLEHSLMSLKIEPVVLQNLPGGGDTIIEKLDRLTQTDYACVLLTPDDEGHIRTSGAELRPRARQNVILELGMVLARLGRRRVAILVKGGEIERPSDIDGLIYIPFQDHVKEARNTLAANLQEAGFQISIQDLL